MMYQEGNKLWFTLQGLTQALLALSGMENRQLEDLVESNIDNPKAPYVSLFAVASDYDWLIDLSYELNNPSDIGLTFDALCADPSCWQLNDRVWDNLFAQVMMVNWYKLLNDRPNSTEFTTAIEVLGEWRLNQFGVNFLFDKWCFASTLKSDYLLATSHFDSTYLRHRDAFRPITY